MTYYYQICFLSENPDTWRFVMWEYDFHDKQVILDCCDCENLKLLENKVKKLKKLYQKDGTGFREAFLYW